MADTEKGTGTANKSFLDTVYEEITSVIGGDNPEQYFCMSLPGTLVNADDYKYDVKAEKPAHVKANESKLVNKMYDASFVSAADNGKHLQTQYRTALNMLSPKLNRELFEMKVRLREVLMTPYPYDFGDGMEESLTLEQVFYRLYNEYVKAKEAWAKKQAKKKAKLKRTIIDPKEREDAYLDWYGSVAEAEKVLLEEKMGEVLNVFSPSDMNIINGILNCSVGAELEEARNTMDMVEELSPDGGYVYPVSLYPSNWFDLLDSSFTGVDLLESPAALSQRMKTLEMQQSNLILNLSKITSVIPDDKDVDALHTAYKKAADQFTDLTAECTKVYVGATADLVKSIVALCTKEKKKDKDGKEVESIQVPSDEQVARIVNDGKSDKETVSDADIKKLIDTIQGNALKCFDAQAATVDAAGKATDAALAWCEAKNNTQLKALVEPLKTQLESVNQDISELKDKLALAKAVASDDKLDSGTANVMPNEETDGFTQVLINSKMSEVFHSSNKQSSSSASSWGVSFFLGGYSCNKSHQEAIEQAQSESSEMEIQIGMNVAKVQIEREWFNPAVFQLTDSMYNFSSNRISSDNTTSFASENTEEVKKRFADMNECIFPSYPVAFVIAKDVSIRFSSQSDISSSFAQSVEDHASQGGGFLIFSGNSSSASSSSQSAATASSTAKSVTVRFTAPQILGFYMQATPKDKSAHINSTSENDMSVIGFVSKFKEMITEYNASIRDKKKDEPKE
ncbi:MAG: hypothetical protein LUH14_13245 [Clostridiaceae bacterium]|nr:hypothetical protein [Clostridiaceae bacterium]